MKHFLDRRALRNRRVLFTTKGAPFSVSVYHAGALAPATNVVIADELTCGQAGVIGLPYRVPRI